MAYTAWYATREQVKRAIGINGASQDTVVDRIIEAISRRIDRETRRTFIPQTLTRLYSWPQAQPGLAWKLWLDTDLISVTTLRTKAQDASPTTIAAADYFLEPVNLGPPYDRIEIDLSSSSFFEAGATPQRSVSVAGSWGYSNDTKAAGAVSSGLATDAGATSMVCSNAALIDVGDTLLIQSEQVFISDRSFAALGTILLDMVGNLAADKAVVTVTVDAGHGITTREIIRIDSERMYVEAVSGNNLTVVRAYDGSVLASHNDNTAIHINRTLTITRGVNGTTAATHANATAISKYQPPMDIVELCVAEVVTAYQQEQAAWGRIIGEGEGQREFSGRSLADLRKRVLGTYRRMRVGTI